MHPCNWISLVSDPDAEYRDRNTNVSMYALVGKSGGSQPMLRALEGWYTRIQSMLIVAGRTRFSKSIPPKFSENPRFAMIYC